MHRIGHVLLPTGLSCNHYTQFNKGCSFFNNLHNVIPVSTSMAMLKTKNKFKKQHDSCVYYHGSVSSKYIDGLLNKQILLEAALS